MSKRIPSPATYVTQKDIARLANVSQAAVAAALGRTDKIRVSDKTREKVLKAAEQLNYLPNQSASITRSGRTKQVALLIRGSASYAIFDRLTRLATRLREAGLTVMARELQWSDGGLEDAWDHALAARAEAIVLSSGFGTIHAPMHRRLINSPVPVLSLCGPSFPGVPLVAPDYRSAFYTLTKRLLASGLRRLVMLKRYRQPDPIEQIAWKAGDRMDGFLDAVREARAEESCRVLEVLNRNPSRPLAEYDLGALGLSEAVEADGRPPEAMICANDRLAMGVLTEARRRGIVVPDEMKVAGCDGEVWTGYGALPITTILQPSYTMADEAAALLLRMMEGEKPENERLFFPCELLWRDSCPEPAEEAPVTAPKRGRKTKKH